ncbi:hypothetical protein [Photobacterium damselae]|uniref:hypothetical protein n=1 Tax=Photobacterium damselae TaxID=38293 RepID=UPI002542CEF1
MPNNELKQALLDVRKSQRLLVAFHQRMLPIIQNIATALNSNFYYWHPSNHHKTPQCATNPLNNRWAWDFSPLNDAVFLFLTSETSRDIAQNNEWGFVIRLRTDTSIGDSFSLQNKNWDALALIETPENSRTSLELIAYKPQQTINEGWAWWNIYTNTDFPPTSGDVIEGYKGSKTFCLSVDIKDLFEDDAIDATVATFKDQLITNGFVECFE